MKIAVVFATRHGQTRRVAQHLAAALRARGAETELIELARPAAEVALAGDAAVGLAGSVYLGRHERELVDFVRRHRAALERVPHAFVSVSLSQASAERADATPERRAQAASEVRQALERFVRDTRWRPERLWPVAGALRYTEYNLLVRWIMKTIARRTGAPTDTARDHELTDWAALDRRADELFAALAAPSPQPQA